MEEDIYSNKLDRGGIKPTAIRSLAIKAMMQVGCAVSLLNLETLLDTVDKSTIPRTIVLLLSHRLIHSIDDRGGSSKCIICDNSCNYVVQNLHPHFYCEKCHRTFCLEGTHIPAIDLPKGFTLHNISYVLKGVCSGCTFQKWQMFYELRCTVLFRSLIWIG